MKTAETKIATSILHRQQENAKGPFFKKEGDTALLSDSNIYQPFFTPASSPAIQAKLTIGQPNDKYEKEADQVADQVVQRLASPEISKPEPRSPQISLKPLAISPIQRKCEDCEAEEQEKKIQEKEETVQRKPIFESGEDSIQEKIQQKPENKVSTSPPNIQREEKDGLPIPKDQKIQFGLKVNLLNPSWRSLSPIVGGFSTSYNSIRNGLDSFKNGKEWKPPFTLPPTPQEMEETRKAYCQIFPHSCDPLGLENKKNKYQLQLPSPLLGGATSKFNLLGPNQLKLDTQFLPSRVGAGTINRKCSSCEEESSLMAKSEGGETTAAPSLESTLSNTKGKGAPLPDETRSSMESAFESDFSDVRIHTDSTSVQMNKDLNAQAFAHGSDIYFNSGKYDTSSSSGKHLLAHELTHTVQQGGGIRKQPDHVKKGKKLARAIDGKGLKSNLFAGVPELEALSNDQSLSIGIGTRGEYVSRIQKALLYHNIDLGNSNDDGKFGKKTAKGIKIIQQLYFIRPANGILDWKTLKF